MKTNNIHFRTIDLVILSALLFLLAIPVSLFFVILNTNQVLNNSWLVSITFIPLLIISIFIIVHDISKRPFSLNLMYMLFVFSFLGLAPFIQYITASLPFNNFDLITDKDILLVNILIIIWVIFYFVGYYTKSLHFLRGNLFHKFLNRPVGYKNLKLAFFISIIALLYLYKLGTFLKWTRASYESIIFSYNTSKALIIAIFIRGIPIITLGGYLLMLDRIKRKKQIGVLIVIILILLNIFFNNPLAAPRYWTSAISIGFIMILLEKKIKMGAFLTLCIIIGLLILAPLIDIGRYNLSIIDAVRAVKFTNPTNFLKSANFDAYANIIHTMHYIQENGETWGRQLLGSVFFFIPRTIWSNKPVGSGRIVAKYFNFPNFNVSSPLQAEALINFGVIGLPIFAMIFGRILRNIDDCYKNRMNQLRINPNSLAFIDVIYPFWLGFVFFISRGDLMSSFAYMVGFTLAGFPLIIKDKKIRSYFYTRFHF